MCACFVDMGAPVKTQVVNGLSKLFNIWGQTIEVSDQDLLPQNIQVFVMKKEIKSTCAR